MSTNQTPSTDPALSANTFTNNPTLKRAFARIRSTKAIAVVAPTDCAENQPTAESVISGIETEGSDASDPYNAPTDASQ